MTDLLATRDPVVDRPARGRTRELPLSLRLEQHRAELRSHCRRILGSTAEADDAAQETLVRAWRKYDRFEGRATLKSWLYRIATNVCFDMLDARRRRPLPVDLMSAPPPVRTPIGASSPRAGWTPSVAVGPPPATATDPADLAVSRDTVRLAFVTALQQLPDRQRSVLILREVLRCGADEVAELLGTTVAAVNSILQRARARLVANDTATEDPTSDRSPAALDAAQQDLLSRYVDAFQRHDVDALVALLH
jgi:RNA polymerase sigma-70 factor (ECF subfamily)